MPVCSEISTRGKFIIVMSTLKERKDHKSINNYHCKTLEKDVKNKPKASAMKEVKTTRDLKTVHRKTRGKINKLEYLFSMTNRVDKFELD